MVLAAGFRLATTDPMRFLPALFGVIAALSAFAPARAQTVVENEYSTTEIIAETTGFAPGETTWFAIRQDLREGWHVFWINPGSAGLALELDWSLPEGFSAGAIDHPSPDYIPVGPLASYAHEGTPAFLVPVTAPLDAQPGTMIDITVDARWQICEEICVPEQGRFSFSLPVAEMLERDASVASIFDAARAAQAQPLEADARFSVEGGAYILRLTPPDDFTTNEAFFFVGVEGLVEPASEQEISFEGGDLVVSMTPGWIEGYDGDALMGVLRFRAEDGAMRNYALTAAVEGEIEKPAEIATPAASRSAVSLPLLLAFAFFGGVILNVMPCVFPIVFIKAASFMRSARGNPGVVRRDGVLYTLGVLATFLAIGGLLLLLRSGGEELGWGFHLQSPPVVALSAYVLLLVGLNLAGVFQVGFGLSGAGDGLAAKGGGAGAFFTGALAVVVAAPCIGPLLSAPMGAALILPPLTGVLIFAVLGLGLAAPYLILSMAPGLSRFLPKPGPWMTTFKQALAFPVFAAAAYFVWVLSQQVAGPGLGAVLGGAVFLGFAAWGYERSKGSGRGALVLRILAALATLAAIAPLFRLEAAATKVGEKYGAMSAEAFSQDALQTYRAAGTPVFVDFTAAWCVTCQFDKATIFSDRALAKKFAEQNVVFMVADWTVRDPEITAALEAFGASGVPLYVYYPPGVAPYVFEIPLTKNAVEGAISGTGL